MSDSINYIGNSTLSGTPSTKLKITINDSAITTDKIADEAVTSDKLADAAVTTDKIEDDAVTSEKIAEGQITADHLTETLQEQIDSSVITEEQEYTDTEKETARSNIDALSEEDLKLKIGVIMFDGIADLSEVTVDEGSDTTIVDIVLYDSGNKRFLGVTDYGTTSVAYYAEWASNGSIISDESSTESLILSSGFFHNTYSETVWPRTTVNYFNRATGIFYQWDGSSLSSITAGSGGTTGTYLLLPSMTFEPETGELIVTDDDTSRFSYDEETGELVITM